MTANWQYLTHSEQATCDEYTAHCAFMDWAGYSDAMTERRKASWHWLSARLDYLRTEGKGDDHAKDRAEHIASIVEGDNREVHNPGPHYPKENNTNTEKAQIQERQEYRAYSDTYQGLQDRDSANYNGLKNQRKGIEDAASGKNPTDAGKGWDKNHRQQRHDNLSIALNDGDAYDEWCKTHDPKTGETKDTGNVRDKIGKWHDAHLGITESPPDSNCDTRSDGIRNSQDKTAGGTWLRNQPWCGCWAFMGLYAAGLVKADGSYSWMAAVSSIEDYAKAGKAPFKGWTTDGSKAKKGDLVVLFGRGQHVGTVRSTDSSYAYTWEGNTSSGSGGSQSNGGGSYKRQRSRSSETYGYALIRD